MNARKPGGDDVSRLSAEEERLDAVTTSITDDGDAYATERVAYLGERVLHAVGIAEEEVYLFASGETANVGHESIEMLTQDSQLVGMLIREDFPLESQVESRPQLGRVL